MREGYKSQPFSILELEKVIDERIQPIEIIDFGEFAPTRTYYGHGADKKAKR